MNCAECQDLIPAYALNALTGEEREQVRAHLATGCPQCTAELTETAAVLAQVPLTLDPVRPGPGVKSRLMERVGAGRAARDPRAVPAVPAEPAALRPHQGRRWRWAESLVAAAAAAAVAATILWVKIDRQQGEIADLQSELDRQHARIDQLQASLDQAGNTIHLFASPAVQLVSLQGSADQPAARGRVFWDRDRGAFHLYASGLKPLPPGKAYELWFINAGQKKIPAGTFASNPRGEASLVATAPADAGRIAALAVTDEPAGGSPQPTGHIQLIGQPG